jgi:hypothetical protein
MGDSAGIEMIEVGNGPTGGEVADLASIHGGPAVGREHRGGFQEDTFRREHVLAAFRAGDDREDPRRGALRQFDGVAAPPGGRQRGGETRDGAGRY